MRKTLFFFFNIISLSIIFFFFISCGIPEVLPFLEIPIANQNSYIIQSSLDFIEKSLIFKCNNSEPYFKGYLIFYRDSNLYLKQGYFSYYDNQSNKWVVVNSIPAESELPDYLNTKDFQFTFYLSNINYPYSNTNEDILDNYLILKEDKESSFSELYEQGKSISLYLVPIGEDIKGIYVYTPAFSTTSNRVVFNFK